MDGPADPGVRATAAEVGGHGPVDGVVVRLGLGSQKVHDSHDDPGLAVAALGDVLFVPGPEHGVRHVVFIVEPLHRHDLTTLDVTERSDAGSYSPTVHVDRAGSTEAPAAAVLGPLQVQMVSKRPQQGHLRRDVDAHPLPVHLKLDGHARTSRLVVADGAPGIGPTVRPLVVGSEDRGVRGATTAGFDDSAVSLDGTAPERDGSAGSSGVVRTPRPGWRRASI